MRTGTTRITIVSVIAAMALAMVVIASAGAASPNTIFGLSTPATIDSGDGHAVELGVKFSSEAAGSVTGIRFYKASTNTGVHVGSLWSASGTLLASATFSGETGSGWQQVSFSTPVAISANTTYIAGYFAPKGHYSATSSGLTSAVSSPPLRTIANSVSPDGVYSYSSTSTFPANSFKATNYWVDVNFEATTVTAAPAAPAEVSATPGSSSATVTWSAPANGGSTITKYTVTPFIGASAQPATTVNGSPPATSTTVAGLKNGTAYTFRVSATNAIGTGPESGPSNAVTPSSEPIAYPDLQVLMPTGEISIIHGTSTRTLEFTHISWDAGAGPLEIRPVYNSLTGISQGYQALYTMSKPGVWTFDHTVPIVGPMIWEPPSDYRFPLDKFWLYDSSGSGGGPGSIVAASPKVDFCMTSDVQVGGVPNTPAANEYPSGECKLPSGRLGLSVGWGDQYDATDGGEGIDISSLPNGTYWLRGEIDPEHYFSESNTANNITDTKLQIEGTTIKVIEQTHPSSTPPTVTITTPVEGGTVAGTTTLTASASGPAPITSVQFLLDGQPIGSPVTQAPYTFKWTIGSTPPGSHLLSAQAIDSNGTVGTAPDMTINVKEGSGEGGPDEQIPTISIVNPVAGQTVSNTMQVSANAADNVGVSSVQFFLDGSPLGAPVTSAPYAVSWNTTTASEGSHTLTATATDTSGNVGKATPVTVNVENPATEGPCFVMDVNTTVAGRGAVTTAPFTTAEPGELLLALVSSDGPSGAGKQSSTITGAGLTWTLVARANSRSGDSEIWQARSVGALANATVTSTPLANNYDETLTLISMQMSNGIGAVTTAGAASGEAKTTLTTTGAGSLVYAVGNDWDTATSRSLGPNQVILRQFLDTKTGDTFWSQYTGAVSGAAGESITLNDPLPTKDQWNMAAVEILGDGD